MATLGTPWVPWMMLEVYSPSHMTSFTGFDTYTRPGKR